MRIMRNKIVRNMLIFLSTLAMISAVPFTATSVSAWSGTISGGGTGGSGNDPGTTSDIYCTKYKSNDCGYRLFLVPKDEHMKYKKFMAEHDEGQIPFKHGNNFVQNEDWISFNKQRSSVNLSNAAAYYTHIYDYARLGAYEIHSCDVNGGGSTLTNNIYAYAAAKGKYLTHYGVSIRNQMMGNDYNRKMTFDGIFRGNTKSLVVFDRFTFNQDAATTGSVGNWGDKMFLKDNLASYEKVVQQIKDWMKTKKSVYASYKCDDMIDAYNLVMSTPNSELDIVIEPLNIMHDRDNFNQTVVYSYTDALMATRMGTGFGYRDIRVTGRGDYCDYARDFGGAVTPSHIRSFLVFDNFKFKPPFSKYHVKTHTSEFRTTNGNLYGWLGGLEAYRIGFVHYTPTVYEDGSSSQMGVSHNIVIVDKSDVLGTKNGSGTTTVSIDPKDVTVAYGSATVASTSETDKNTAKAGSPAYNVFNTASRLDDWDEIYKTSTASVSNPSTGKKTTLNKGTFQRLVYSIWGPRYSDDLGVFATNENKPQYDADIAKVGGVSYAHSTDKVKSKANLWYYGSNRNMSPSTYGDFMYAGAGGMQLDEWSEITKDNQYDITQVSTAKLTHKGVDSESKGYQYYALTVGTQNSDGYMANHIRDMNKNFQKTAKRTSVPSSEGTNVLGSRYTNTITYKGTSDPLSGTFAKEIIKTRQDYAGGNYPDIKTDTVKISYYGKNLVPTSDASKKMSSNDDTAKSYKRDFLYNLWGLTAASSNMKVHKKDAGTIIKVDKNTNSYETLSVAVLQKKKTVTSYMAFARLEVTKSSKKDRVGTYSLAQTGSGAYRKYNVASNGKFNVDPKSGMGSVMSGSSKDKTYHYLVSWQNNQTPSSASYDFSKSSRDSVAQAIGNALTSYANSHNGLGQGNSDSVSKLKNFFKTEVGVDLKLCVKKDAKNKWSLATGAVENSEGELDGYSSMVISWEDDEFQEIAEDGLRPHELNVLLPDLLGFTHIYGNKNHKYATEDEMHKINRVVIDVKWHRWYEAGGDRSSYVTHCVIPYQYRVDDYHYEWVPSVYDKNGNLVSGGYYKYVYDGWHYETRYNYYGYTHYYYQRIDGDRYVRTDYNVQPPYQIWDTFSGTGIWNKIPNGKNTAFFYYNKTGNFRQRSTEKSHNFAPGESTIPSYLYSLSRRVWDDMAVGCNFVGSLSSETGGYSTYRSFMTRTLGLNYDNKPSGRTYKVGANNTKKATEKRWDTITFDIVPNRPVTNEGGAKYPTKQMYFTSSCSYCGATFVSSYTNYDGQIGDVESYHTKYNGYGWQDETLKHGFYYRGSDVHTSATYTINHFMTKYNCLGKPSGTIGVENKIHKANNGTNKFEWAVLFEEEAKQSLHIYPEVEMRLYYAEDNSSGAANPRIVDNTYAMGEKERDFAATSLRLVNLRGSDDSFYNGTNDNKFLTAKLTSDTIAQSGDAKSLQSGHRTDDGRILPVIYAGGNYNLKIKNEYNIDVTSYTLDIEDSHNGVTIKGGSAGFDVRNDTWSTTKIRQDHLQTVTSIINGIELSMKMQTTPGYSNRFVASPVKTYNDLKIKGSKIKTPPTKSDKVFHLKFKEGAYLENGTGKYTLEGLRPLIQDVAKEYNISESEARRVLEDSGIIKSVKMALESRFDADNKSTVEKGFHEGNKWYDEECSVIIVRKLKSQINLGDVVVTDKIDLTAGPKRTSGERDAFFQNSYNAAFYYYLKLKPADVNLPDDAEDMNATMWKLGNESFLDVSKYKTIIDAFHVKDGDFLIPTATTSDMRNNI